MYDIFKLSLYIIYTKNVLKKRPENVELYIKCVLFNKFRFDISRYLKTYTYISTLTKGLLLYLVKVISFEEDKGRSIIGGNGGPVRYNTKDGYFLIETDKKIGYLI